MPARATVDRHFGLLASRGRGANRTRSSDLASHLVERATITNCRADAARASSMLKRFIQPARRSMSTGRGRGRIPKSVSRRHPDSMVFGLEPKGIGYPNRGKMNRRSTHISLHVRGSPTRSETCASHPIERHAPLPGIGFFRSARSSMRESRKLATDDRRRSPSDAFLEEDRIFSNPRRTLARQSMAWNLSVQRLAFANSDFDGGASPRSPAHGATVRDDSAMALLSIHCPDSYGVETRYATSAPPISGWTSMRFS